VTVRRIGPSDWGLLRDVRLRALVDAPDAFASSYEREAGFDETQWRERASGAWFAAAAAEPAAPTIGIVAGYRDPDRPPHQRQLVAMWVAPDARGTGIAARLVEAVVDWSRADGAIELILGVVDDNHRARAFYLRCGFTSTGQRVSLHNGTDRQIETLRRPL
jgi:GNAT superfamily N-acetyltransferase